MATFGRTPRQDTIWEELNAIREYYPGLLDPTEGGYVQEEDDDPELVDLQDDWDDLVEEYEEIHVVNATKG